MPPPVKKQWHETQGLQDRQTGDEGHDFKINQKREQQTGKLPALQLRSSAV